MVSLFGCIAVSRTLGYGLRGFDAYNYVDARVGWWMVDGSDGWMSLAPSLEPPFLLCVDVLLTTPSFRFLDERFVTGPDRVNRMLMLLLLFIRWWISW